MVRIICQKYLQETELNIKFCKLESVLNKLIEPKQMENTIGRLLEKWIFNECFKLFKELKIYHNLLNVFNKKLNKVQ